MVRSCTKKGFTLVELIIILALSGLLIGTLITLWGDFIQESSPETIEYNGTSYEVAPSLAATIEAFDFHQEFINCLASAELCLCFGGAKNDYKSHCFLPLSNDFPYEQLLNVEPLIQGKIHSTYDLVEHLSISIEAFFEKKASDSDLTCILLGRDLKTSIFVQLRKQVFVSNNIQYHLYSVEMNLLENAKQLNAYRYAIKSTEDTYKHCNCLQRFFCRDQEQRRESFDLVIFPDPYLVSNNEKSDLSSLSRFTYILDGF